MWHFTIKLHLSPFNSCWSSCGCGVWVKDMFLIYNEYFYIGGCVTNPVVYFWSAFMHFKTINSLFFSPNTYVDAMPKLHFEDSLKNIHPIWAHVATKWHFQQTSLKGTMETSTYIRHVWGQRQQLVNLISKLEVREIA